MSKEREALERAAGVFHHYAALHRKKGTESGHAKADANQREAELCEAALAQTAESPKCGAEFFDDWICDLPAKHLEHHGGIPCERWAKMNIDEPPLDRGVNAADVCVVVQSPAPAVDVCSECGPFTGPVYEETSNE